MVAMMIMNMVMMIIILEEFGTEVLVRKVQVDYKRILYFQSFFLRNMLFKFDELCSELRSHRSIYD